MLVEFAPDHHVIETSWFAPDPKNVGKVTRAHKVSCVICGGLDPKYVEIELGIYVSAERQALLKTVCDIPLVAISTSTGETMPVC